MLSATSTDLNNAGNDNLANVEIVTAAAAGAAVSINLSSQTEALTIIGASTKANTITGGNGASTITGGSAADVITGGATGINTFVYTTLGDSIAATYDTIQDFKAKELFKVSHAVDTANV